jgi:CheY-like chemotaxis protein
LHHGNAISKGLKLFVTIDAGVAEYLSGDSVRLCQMLNNLVGNAVKFTATGAINIAVEMLKENSNHQTLQFTVTDTGIGIAANKLNTIFESFSQADNSISSNYGGTGLGLTITKKLIELQGGNIKVASQIGKGTSFIFTLKFEKVNVVTYKNEKSKLLAGNTDLNDIKVLVAEDNKVNAMVLGKFLQKWNVSYHVAINGKEAIAALDANDYNIVLMDLHMPIMGGKEATKQIRNAVDKHYNNIPIIALTADATQETQQLILASGFNHYVTKPFNPENLFKVLKNYSAVLAG